MVHMVLHLSILSDDDLIALSVLMEVIRLHANESGLDGEKLQGLQHAAFAIRAERNSRDI